MTASTKGTWERLTEFVKQGMEAKSVPGVAVGLLHEGEMSTVGLGVTNVEHPLPVTDETLFQIGSITKTFTGTAIMRLVEDGKLELDAPVRRYAPDFKVADEAAAAGATVRHLLTHMGGWAGDLFRDTGKGDDALARYVADMAELPQLAPLGTIWSYNNAGFSLAGYLIEAATGQTYEAALKELILEPLGLEHAYLDPGQVITHRFAVGHNTGEEGARVARPWPLARSAYAAGGIVCHVKDLLRYARFHLGDGQTEDGTHLLSAGSLAQMQSPQVTVWGKEAWGLTWAIEEIDEARQVSHRGGTNGQITLLGLIPEKHLAFAVLTNSDRGGEVTDKVRRWILKEYLGLDAPEPQPVEANEEELAQYAGRYTGFFDDIELGMLGGKLVGQVTYKRGFPNEETPPRPAPPPMSLGKCEKDRLVVIDGRAKGDRAEVIRQEDDRIGWLRVGGRLHVRQA
jgi:CubicO group peptidase (beta-lactamase class C family)